MARRILRNRRHPDLRVFEEDFDAVAARFKGIMDKGCWIALPGAVVDTVVPSSENYRPLVINADQMQGYKMDTGTVLQAEKRRISKLLSRVEGREVGLDTFTLTPGVSSALLFVSIALKRLGIGELVVELPAYFASIEQAEILGLPVALFPGARQDGYRITPMDLSDFDRISDDPIALIITQPRYGMGYNRDAAEVDALRRALRAGDFIIVDEAADQSVPSPLGNIELDAPVRVVRVRGITKGLGLNSAKIAAILHPDWMRPLFGEIVDYAGGAIDAAALQLALDLSETPDQYVSLLRAAQAYVRSQHTLLQRSTLGLPIKLSPIESSYLATAHFPIIEGMSLDEFREFFLTAAVELNLPVVRGSSLYFPYDGSGEMIRINYFTPAENMLRSGDAFHRLVTFLYGHPGPHSLLS